MRWWAMQFGKELRRLWLKHGKHGRPNENPRCRKAKARAKALSQCRQVRHRRTRSIRSAEHRG
jgi:hypothetical protein